MKFIKQVTEFNRQQVAPFGGDIDAAIGQLMDERWWEANDDGTPAPDNLPQLIRAHVERMLDS